MSKQPAPEAPVQHVPGGRRLFLRPAAGRRSLAGRSRGLAPIENLARPRHVAEDAPHDVHQRHVVQCLGDGHVKVGIEVCVFEGIALRRRFMAADISLSRIRRRRSDRGEVRRDAFQPVALLEHVVDGLRVALQQMNQRMVIVGPVTSVAPKPRTAHLRPDHAPCDRWRHRRHARRRPDQRSLPGPRNGMRACGHRQDDPSAPDARRIDRHDRRGVRGSLH
jgi:hypothetical protein